VTSPRANHLKRASQLFDVLENIVKIRKMIRRSACLVAAGVAVGLLLSGCATARPNGPDGCVGPPDFCQPYFGN
jgi:predicted small secreted protein